MKLLASRIKGAEFLVVPNAGHSVYWEEPEYSIAPFSNSFGSTKLILILILDPRSLIPDP